MLFCHVFLPLCEKTLGRSLLQLGADGFKLVFEFLAGSNTPFTITVRMQDERWKLRACLPALKLFRNRVAEVAEVRVSTYVHSIEFFVLVKDTKRISSS